MYEIDFPYGDNPVHEEALQMLVEKNPTSPFGLIDYNLNKFVAQNPNADAAAIIHHVQQKINDQKANQPAFFVGGIHHDPPLEMQPQAASSNGSSTMTSASWDEEVDEVEDEVEDEEEDEEFQEPFELVQPVEQIPFEAICWQPPGGFRMAPPAHQQAPVVAPPVQLQPAPAHQPPLQPLIPF